MFWIVQLLVTITSSFQLAVNAYIIDVVYSAFIVAVKTRLQIPQSYRLLVITLISVELKDIIELTVLPVDQSIKVNTGV